ncbi:hypothetical protein X975_10244, partial [Stegodyphus mimosarum]
MTCKLPHHTILHYERNSKIGENEQPKLNTGLSPSTEVFLPRNKEVVTHATTCTGHFSDPKCSGKRVLLCTAVIKGDIIKRGQSVPFGICSQLGWIISGSTFTDNSSTTTTNAVNNLKLSTNELVEKFWSLDSVPEVKHISSEDKECEEFFKTTHFRDQSGRYVVKLQFKGSSSKLGNSKDLALQRLKSLEQKLLRSPDTYEMYKQCMKEYLDLGHMESICGRVPDTGVLHATSCSN